MNAQHKARPCGRGARALVASAVVLILTCGAPGAAVYSSGTGGPVTLLADTPPTEQGPGEHSTISTSDGNIRDDELAEWIGEQIPKDGNGVPQVHDVKIFLNSCYGGGILDDIGRVLGPMGVPWVGGSASSADESAWGPTDEAVDGGDAGSYWTDSLVDAIEDGGLNDKVSDDIKDANDNDPKNPDNSTNDNVEHPQYASGNGGDDIKWGDADKHEVIIFGGKNNADRHDNNMDNTEDAFDDLFSGDPHNIQSSDDEGDSTQDLKDMITAAAANLDPDTQLVIYIDDHGDTEFDWWEWVTEKAKELILDPVTGWVETASLHDGWEPGLLEMDAQAVNDPLPWLTIGVDPLSQRALLPQDWQLQLNGVPIPLTGPILPGQSLQLAVDWTSIQNGPNTLEFFPTSPGGGPPVTLSGLELGSGPISESEDDSPLTDGVIPEPATMVLLAMGGVGALLRRRKMAA